MMRTLLLWPVGLCLCCLLAACTAGGGAAPSTAAPPNPMDSAAAEATAIVQRARATALVLQARAQATALIRQAESTATPQPGATRSLPAAGLTPAPPLASTELEPSLPATSQGEVMTVPVTSTTTVEVLGVSLAAESGYIMVQFRAPPRVAQEWWQGRVSVVDEATGTVYNEIPVIPKVGPLIGRPVEEGQLGYVMLVNAPVPLGPGGLVTVVLGAYTFEHLPVQ